MGQQKRAAFFMRGAVGYGTNNSTKGFNVMPKTHMHQLPTIDVLNLITL